ncbi:UNVERIFIED_CONTAM: hypothetical protein GTU68_060744, partial [Idotea baltica]|nr:hypothetical protein [Idotea baltica]
AQATQKRIALPEATDERVLKAAAEIAKKKLARPILIGGESDIRKHAERLGVSLTSVCIEDPEISTQLNHYNEQLVLKRQHRGMNTKKATLALKNSFTYACMMMNAGEADGCVAGAITPTVDVVRGAMQLVQKHQDTKLVSSFFIMRLNPQHPVDDVLIIADCALVIDPNPQELAAIAASTGDSVKQLLDIDPEVGMLSFSTAGSARHKHVSKVREAADELRRMRPHWRVVGEVQLDAAVIPDILAKKAPDQASNTPCNTLIFPNLDAGNIGYKLIERFGGAQAIGPILQGLKQPVNDLSRGCSQNDIVNLVAVTAAQCE